MRGYLPCNLTVNLTNKDISVEIIGEALEYLRRIRKLKMYIHNMRINKFDEELFQIIRLHTGDGVLSRINEVQIGVV